MPLITFLDESGTHDGSRVVTVAGFMLTSESLPELEQEWRSELDKRGVVELHMREFVPPYGSCSGWTGEAKRALFSSLIEIIHRHTHCAVGAAIEVDEFFKNIYQVQMERYPQIVKSPYSLCMRYCIAQVADWCRNNDVAGPVDYVMDQGNPRRSEAQKEYTGAKQNPELTAQFYLGNLAFADSTTTVGLQCADLLAYEMYKEADRRLSGAARRPRGSFVALLRDNDRLMTIDSKSLQRKRVIVKSGVRTRFRWLIRRRASAVSLPLLPLALWVRRPGRRRRPSVRRCVHDRESFARISRLPAR